MILSDLCEVVCGGYYEGRVIVHPFDFEADKFWPQIILDTDSYYEYCEHGIESIWAEEDKIHVVVDI